MDAILAQINAWLSALGFSEWLGLISATIAVSSFILNLGVVRRQTAMQFESLRTARDADIIKWADCVIEAMADAQKLCRDKDKILTGDEFTRAQSETRTRLSALLDRGRLFFPNFASSDHGADKETAFQGHRQPALDSIYDIYRIVSDVGRAEERGDPVAAIVNHKRIFVSQVFDTVDPRRRQAVMSRLDYRRARRRQRQAVRESQEA